MVFHRFPQSHQINIDTNTNFPPQSGGDAAFSSQNYMLYENLEIMHYEDDEEMEYET